MVANHPIAPQLPPSASRHEQELRWYFTEARGELELSSNFEAMRRIFLCGRSPDRTAESPSYHEERLDAARRERRIRTALQAAGPVVEDVLEACLSGDAPPHLAAFGVLAGLVPNLPEAHQAHRASGSPLPLESWLGRQPNLSRTDAKAHVLMNTLLAEATHLFLWALDAYAEAKRRVGSR